MSLTAQPSLPPDSTRLRRRWPERKGCCPLSGWLARTTAASFASRGFTARDPEVSNQASGDDGQRHYAAASGRPQSRFKQPLRSQQRAEARHQLHVSSAHAAQQIKNQEHTRASQRAEQRRACATPAMLHRLQNQTAGEGRSQESNWKSGDACRSSIQAAIPTPPANRACAVTGRPPCQTVCRAPCCHAPVISALR